MYIHASLSFFLCFFLSLFLSFIRSFFLFCLSFFFLSFLLSFFLSFFISLFLYFFILFLSLPGLALAGLPLPGLEPRAKAGGPGGFLSRASRSPTPLFSMTFGQIPSRFINDPTRRSLLIPRL